MPTFDSAGFEIAYDDIGEGPPIVLVHGFAANFELNWRRTGWVDALVESGRRVVGLDCRGHGHSAKPHDPAAYAGRQLPCDVLRLMDQLEIESAELMGYSMGGMIATDLLAHDATRFNAVIIGGIGGTRLQGFRRAPAVAAALSADKADAADDRSFGR